MDVLWDNLKWLEDVPVLSKEPTVPVSNSISAPAFNIDMRLLYARTEDAEVLNHSLRNSYFKGGRSTYCFENVVMFS